MVTLAEMRAPSGQLGARFLLSSTQPPPGLRFQGAARVQWQTLKQWSEREAPLAVT